MYKRALPFKNIILGFNNVHVTAKRSFSTKLSPVKIDKVLVVTKLTRYQYEKNRHRNLTEAELHKELLKRGANLESLLHYHHLHKNFEDRVISSLRDLGIEVKITNKINYTTETVDWADLIVSTGGDGTFLVAASKVRDNKKPVVGFNSDPRRSEGYLCLPKKYSIQIKEAIDRLRGGRFLWLLRDRLRIILQGKVQCLTPKHLFEADSRCASIDDILGNLPQLKTEHGQILPVLALNEVFVGETLSARASQLEVSLNNGSPFSVKCSGICITTGTGSSSWHLSMNRLPVQTVMKIFDIINYEPTMEKEKAAALVAKSYNKHLIFPEDSGQMAYTIRDFIAAGVWPNPKGIRSRGFATSMSIKSSCFDATLVVDGGMSFAFSDGVTARFEIHPEDSLRTVIFST